jgi:DNA-binding MurR/RpiR family transcriptional regulator
MKKKRRPLAEATALESKLDAESANLAVRIRTLGDSLTPAEQRIIDILFSSNLLAGLDTVAKLAARARVSGPTVLRLAAKLGFESYPGFQDFLKGEIEVRLASPLQQLGSKKSKTLGGSLATEAETVFSGAIRRTLSRIDDATLKRVTALLIDPSRSISLIGGQFTHHLAEILFGHLHQLRARTHILRNGVASLQEQMVDIGRRDVLVVFDIRRYQEDIIRLAELAKQQRATIVLITDPLLSPIARSANIVLTCDLDSPSPYDSLVTCMVVVETLVAALTRATNDRSLRRLTEIEKLREAIFRK